MLFFSKLTYFTLSSATLDSPLVPVSYSDVHRSSDKPKVSSGATKAKAPSSQVTKTSSLVKQASSSRLPLPSSKQLRS